MLPASSAGKSVRARASRDWLVWVLLLIGRESGARFFNQSQSEVKQNQSKTRITFDTQLKTALKCPLVLYISTFLQQRARSMHDVAWQHGVNCVRSKNAQKQLASIRRQKSKNRFLSYFAHKWVVVKLEPDVVRFPPKRFIFEKKEEIDSRVRKVKITGK